MRALLLVLLLPIVACKKPDPPALPSAAPVDAGEAAPAEDVGTAEELCERALVLKSEHPGEAIRLFKKAVQLAPGDPALAAKVKVQLSQFEPVMRDRAREAYLFGFELRNTSPNDAARNFEQAMHLSPRGDAIYEKAKEQLSRLKQRQR